LYVLSYRYTPKQVFDVVSNVNQYKYFIPHVKNSKILKYKNLPAQDCPPGIKSYQPTAYMSAELEVGFPPFLEKYVSDIIVRDATYVRATAQSSKLFTHLGNIWELKPGPTPNSCTLTFHVDFGFASKWYQKVADMFFNFLVKRMTDAFEHRCKQLYGPPSTPTVKVMQNTNTI